MQVCWLQVNPVPMQPVEVPAAADESKLLQQEPKPPCNSELGAWGLGLQSFGRLGLAWGQDFRDWALGI